MINIIFRLLLTFNATSLLLIIYFVKSEFALLGLDVLVGRVFSFVGIEAPRWMLAVLGSGWPSFLIYFMVPVALTGFTLKIASRLGKDSFAKGSVESIEHANNSFLPSYLGYFFVALSIGSWDTLWFVYFVLFAFTFRSQALYFNPLFLLFGYEFYNIKTCNGTMVFLISRQRYKRPDDVDIKSAFRINNYTFIEKG